MNPSEFSFLLDGSVETCQALWELEQAMLTVTLHMIKGILIKIKFIFFFLKSVICSNKGKKKKYQRILILPQKTIV